MVMVATNTTKVTGPTTKVMAHELTVSRPNHRESFAKPRPIVIPPLPLFSNSPNPAPSTPPMVVHTTHIPDGIPSNLPQPRRMPERVPYRDGGVRRDILWPHHFFGFVLFVRLIFFVRTRFLRPKKQKVISKL
mmetsp:Transcript_19639/g.22594  ORF Transcript_19639/g.22594 Transcript_19639/m.22594 type:complete len:133 (+) Transcript_19639:85-483(+)